MNLLIPISHRPGGSLRALLPLLALTGGCPGKEGLLTSHEADASSSGQTDTGGDDTVATAPTEASAGGDCETSCPAEVFPCLGRLGWSDGLIAMTMRQVSSGLDEAPQVVLLRIDPVTAAQTLLGEGELASGGYELAVAGDGSIFVAGSVTDLEALSSSALLLKFAPTGELLWQVAPDAPVLVDLVVRGDEVLVVDQAHEVAAFSAADGAPLWDIPGAVGSAHALEVDADDAVYVAGADAFPHDDVQATWYLRKYAADHTLAWEHVSVADVGEQPGIEGLALDEAGGAVLIVRRHESGQSDPDLLSVHKFHQDGTGMAWARSFPEIVANLATDDTIAQLTSRPGGGVLIVGGIRTDNAAFSLALDPDGEVLWTDVSPGKGLVYQTNWTSLVHDGTLLVSGCGTVDADLGGREGWLVQLTP